MGCFCSHTTNCTDARARKDTHTHTHHHHEQCTVITHIYTSLRTEVVFLMVKMALGYVVCCISDFFAFSIIPPLLNIYILIVTPAIDFM